MRKLATIRRVKEILSIENSDNICLAKIDGWQVVVRKGEFSPGSLCVYFEIDSYLPIEERYEFLRKSSYKKLENIRGRRNEGFRLKTIKLRGMLSQGLAMPLSAFPDLEILLAGMSLHEGDNVTDLLKVELYEPPVPACIAGEVKGAFPSFIRKTDEERI